MERLEIVTISDTSDNDLERKINGFEMLSELLDKFNLNETHSFGQGEELNLRQILYNIGEDRIEELRVSIKTVVEKKLKRLRRSLMYHKLFKDYLSCNKTYKPVKPGINKVTPDAVEFTV